MSRTAWVYIGVVLFGAATLSGLVALNLGSATLNWQTFITFTVLATIAQLFEAEHGKQSFYPHFVFFSVGVVLLDPFLLILLVSIPHFVEWGKEWLTPGARRRKWYIQPFNIAAHIIPGLSAYWVYALVVSNTTDLQAASPLLAASAAIAAYIGLNHLMVGLVLALARGISWKQSRVLTLDCLLPDAIMSALGYVVAVLWVFNPWLTILALSPLVLMYQALMVPQLKQDAYTDAKTGLWNARHFATLFSAEMERARRFDRPISLIMADLDLLRNINNTYGHLAGDAVLEGIGRIIKEKIRDFDIAGRFGGEEFAIALTETHPEEALEIAERLREAVEASSFDVTTSAAPIQVTMSIGVASFPGDAITSNDLIHEADVAVYQAKLIGRNCVVRTSNVPHYVKLGIPPIEDRLDSVSTHTFIPRPTAVGRTAVLPSQEPRANHTSPLTSVLLEPVQPEAETQSSQQKAAGTISPERPKQPEGPQNPKSKIQNQGAISSATLLHILVWSVIAIGLTAAGLGAIISPQYDLLALVLFTALAAIAEMRQISLYGENTVSVSVALAFAAALIVGIPGVACVSAVIALAHFIQKRPALYKTAFNWATHLLAGLAPALTMLILRASGIQVEVSAADLPVLALPVAAASIVYYLIDTGLIAGAIALSTGTRLVPAWRETFGWLAMHYVVLCVMGLFLGIAYTAIGVVGVVVFTLPVVMMRVAQKQYVEKTQDSMQELKRMNVQLALANEEVVSAHAAMQHLNDELFFTLSKLIDARDPYVGNHASKVADYAVAIAVELGLSQDRMEPLRQAGFLHDIGKIALSEEVLHKPSKLTDEEYEYVKTHAALGGEFLEMCGGLRHLVPFVRHHHERWDGRGYPDCLKGEDIPLEARILSVCDSAEAMASDRPYRKGMSLQEVINEVRRCAGTQFDPDVAEAFAQIAEREREEFVTNSAASVMPRYFGNGNRPVMINETPSPNRVEMPVAV
ncbi:MAG TPA: diguanylate cyclase [Chloroflexia bacterium]|nr:diguanylate cyclase [Chloroflexia bacterium]